MISISWSNVGRCAIALAWCMGMAQAAELTIVAPSPGAPVGTQDTLARWDQAQLKALKQKGSRERDPKGGETVAWSGVLLSDLLDKSLEKVPAERRSLYDLLIVKGAGGAQALLPRAFIIKYPILLATRRDGKDLGARGPMTVLPWTSNSKIRGETASLVTLFVEGVSSIELANFKGQYPEYRLKKRTEPAAVRGEKLFREACMTCHAVGKGPKVSEISSEAKLKHLLDTGHPEVDGMIKLSQAERRSLVRFLEMLKE